MSEGKRFCYIGEPDGSGEELISLFEFLGYQTLRQAMDEVDALSSAPQDCLGLIVHADPARTSFDKLQALAKTHPLILVEDQPTSAMVADLHESAVAVLTPPFKLPELLTAIHACQVFCKRVAVEQSGKKTNHHLFKNHREMVGVSEPIQTVFHLMRQVAKSDVSVLILGESGTGKEVVSHNLHAYSDRRNKPFIPVNCAAIPADLLESELFGHEKGAFTGAISTRQGRFELAKGGTIFLDEIGDMPLSMQVKLLRVIQERCFERVGSSKSIEADVRIIAATNCNLKDAIASGKFREDLYYRLNVFPIEIPPLRERQEDIPLLINQIIHKLNQENGMTLHILPNAMEKLVQYRWPGNIRELVNMVERLAILHPNGVVSAEDLPIQFDSQAQRSSAAVSPKSASPSSQHHEQHALDALCYQEAHTLSSDGVDLKEHLAKTELALIRQALDESNGIVAQAAGYLHMRRTTLVEKMRKYGISRQDCVGTH